MCLYELTVCMYVCMYDYSFLGVVGIILELSAKATYITIFDGRGGGGEGGRMASARCLGYFRIVQTAC